MYVSMYESVSDFFPFAKSSSSSYIIIYLYINLRTLPRRQRCMLAWAIEGKVTEHTVGTKENGLDQRK
jgi:hypothetical protein